MTKILITGASGLIGRRLTAMLMAKQYEVHHLGRASNGMALKGVRQFVWDVDKGLMDEHAFDGVGAIVHLAGESVASGRWTGARKKRIKDSRVKSTELLYEFLNKGNHKVEAFISASAIGYYGDCGAEMLTEEHKAGKDFLAEVCRFWEKAVIKTGKLGLREVRCRLGIVLAPDGGALSELIKTLPLGFVNYFAQSDLYYSWVHVDDVCGAMFAAIENKNMNGAYNITAPEPVEMKELMRQIIAVKKPEAFLIPAPPLAVKLALGEMSSMLLSSQRCSADKILNSGYRFKYPQIAKAIVSIFGKGANK